MVPLDAFAEGVKSIDESLMDIPLFNFGEEEVVNNHELGRVLKMLEACRYLDFDFEKNYVKMTESGERFAELLEVPTNFRKHMEMQTNTREPYPSYHVSLR